MKFAELHKEISNCYLANDASVAAYLSCIKGIDQIKGDVPAYVRKLRAAFLGSFTIQGLAEVYRAQGIFHNLFVEPYTAPYNQFTQQVLAPASDLYLHDPQIVYFIVDTPDIVDDAHVQDLLAILLERTHAHIVLFNFAASPRSNMATVTARNQRFKELYKSNGRISVFDFAAFLDRIGLSEHWYTKYTELGDFRLSPSAFPVLAESLLAYGIATAGNTKKCVVLDLDNTLWQGIAGEDGADGVLPEKEIQNYLLALFERGIILAINSKNNEEDALRVIEHHPDMILKKNNFAAWRINWESKEKNIAELAEELNLGIESFVFVDDDPFQRELVRTAYPDIAVIPPERLLSYPGFHSFAVTEEDKRRGTMYGEERMRRELQKTFRTEEDFIKQLDLHVEIHNVSEQTVARASQLTQKTNQFNVTTKRYSEEDMKRLIQDGWHIWAINVADRFGDYGIVGVLMIEPKENEWRVDNFLLSCRVLGRGVEGHVINHLLKIVAHSHVRIITAEYRRSAKNQQTEKFWDKNAFTLISEDKEQRVYHYEFTS